MASVPLSLDSYEYVECKKKCWRHAIPTSMIVMEYFGTGDIAFGGTADDRPLGESGRIFKQSWRTTEQVAEFLTLEEAHSAALSIPNRRKGSILGVVPNWR